MQISIDRTTCNCWEGACESCFGWRLLKLMEEGEPHPATCHVESSADGSPDFTFYVHDKDQQDKVLRIDKSNWTEAYESWPELLRKQQAETKGP